MQIAIDGPAGAGKSTAAKRLAKELNVLYLDTGAMYRAATLAVLRSGCPLDDEEKITREALRYEIGFDPNGHVTLDGEDVEDEIRTSRVARHTSDVAPVAAVREALTNKMREIAQGRDVILDGRDIGSVVLPDADFKYFITASPLQRARRRYLEMKEKGTLGGKTLQEIEDEIRLRDKNDSERSVSPLVKCSDAEEILTDTLTPEEVVSLMVKKVRGR